MSDVLPSGDARLAVGRGIRFFDTVAPRYDLMRRLVSGGREARWKRRSLAAAIPCDARVCVDVATGTGDVAALVREVAPTIRVVGVDGNRGMIRRGRTKLAGAPMGWVLADLNRLPLHAAAADVITAAYALRYCVELPVFLARCHTLLRADGVFWAFDLGKPRNPALHAMWVAYLGVSGLLLGLLLHGRPAAYWHLVTTLRTYPGQHRVSAMLREAGFREVHCDELLGGVLAIHVARK